LASKLLFELSRKLQFQVLEEDFLMLHRACDAIVTKKSHLSKKLFFTTSTFEKNGHENAFSCPFLFHFAAKIDDFNGNSLEKFGLYCKRGQNVFSPQRAQRS